MQKTNGVVIYENLQEIVDPSHSCLVVWDVQNGLVDRIFNREEFLENLTSLLKHLRRKMPIVYTLITPPAAEFRSSWYIYSMMRRFNVKEVGRLPSFMALGSRDRDVPDVVKPESGDAVLEKSTASIFIGTNFEYMMRARGVATLLFAGIATEIGIESSARDASNRGFYPVVVSDCVSSADRDAHDRSLKNLERLVIVRNSSEIMDCVKKG